MFLKIVMKEKVPNIVTAEDMESLMHESDFRLDILSRGIHLCFADEDELLKRSFGYIMKLDARAAICTTVKPENSGFTFLKKETRASLPKTNNSPPKKHPQEHAS